MDSKTKLYVFAKKEVALIFVFMILIAVTSFVLGVKIGKNYSMEMAGITPDDQKKVVELLSNKEEELKNIKANPESSTVESSEIEHKLQEKISEEFGGDKPQVSAHGEVASESHGNMSVAPKESASKDALSGKYTIQLGSHRTLKEAEGFAEGFRARGYNPIITQIEIKGKGTWYRVSLEAFNTEDEARAYIKREKSLFVGQDYNIMKMP
ncbi:MAG: SPOR domain-containing protein [Bdellovibrionales bacterium]|nr:SPOR domain-containing protein [Bdellovibrionales bacterium]